MNIDLNAYDTDKTYAYLANYEAEFGERFNAEICLLELGIKHGGSMRLWLDLLPNAKIAGLDLNAVDNLGDIDRLHIYQGVQQDPEILDRIAAEVAPTGFDIVIDDASHLGQYTAASFWHLFPRHLKPGGVYVLDDWSCGYWSTWADGHRYKGTRAALGDFSSGGSPATAQPSRLEMLRRYVRASARPIAERVSDRTRERLERVYMRFDGATAQRRFKSHDYGMVGFVKQLIDASSVQNIDAGKETTFDSEIASIHVYPTQVFVHKR